MHDLLHMQCWWQVMPCPCFYIQVEGSKKDLTNLRVQQGECCGESGIEKSENSVFECVCWPQRKCIKLAGERMWAVVGVIEWSVKSLWEKTKKQRVTCYGWNSLFLFHNSIVIVLLIYCKLCLVLRICVFRIGLFKGKLYKIISLKIIEHWDLRT